LQKTALVTGGARGIGAATVRTLARDGFRVFIGYCKSEEQALFLAEETGGIPLCADVRDEHQVSEMFSKAGGVDVLVNNAGVAGYGLFTDISREIWRDIFSVNVDGTFYCTKCALPHMIRQKDGVIINISSIWGMVGASCETAYSASKAAIIGLTKALAKETGPSGIRVNCIAPGVIDTEMNSALSADDIAELKNQTPLGQIGTPDDIGELIRYLASPCARFITGQVISPNGGFVI